MDKVHKYAEKYCDNVEISANGNSYYYHFKGGKFILRVSDHIGRNSSGKVSIIIDNNGYLLHNHNTGAVHIETYENIKEFIKSLAILNRINVHFDMSMSEIGDLKTEMHNLRQQLDSQTKKNKKLGENNTQINNENVKYKNQWKATKKECENLREEMRCHPIRTWFKLYTRNRKQNKNLLEKSC